MPKKHEFLKVIDQETPVTGGGGLIQQQVQVAPPVPGEIPAPTNLTNTGTGIARSSQAPMAFVDLAWTAPARVTPEYYIIEYTKSTFANAVRLRANERTARVLVDTSSTYYFRVQAVYRTSISDWSNTLTVVTPSDNTAPTDVTSVNATFVNGDVVVTWTEPGPTNETYKDARIRIWNPGRTILYGTYHIRGGTFIWTEAENLRLISGGVTSVSVDVTSRGWNNVYGTAQITSATLSNPTAPTSLVTDFSTGDLIISWTNPTGIPYKDLEVKVYESSSKVTNYKTWYLNGNTVTFTKEDNFAVNATPDTSIYIEVKTRGWLGLISSALSATATHTAPPPVSNLIANFIAGDFIVKWDNPTAAYKDVEVKIYESSSKVTNYKTYYLLGNSVIFTQADNYNVNGSSPDISMFVEVKVRSWLDLLSGSSSYTATLTAPNPVTSVVTDFTTGDLEIRWVNPTNVSYRDVEIKLYESASKVTNYKTYYINGNRVIFSVEDNFNATGGIGDTVIYYEIIVRSWLGVTSSTVSGTATHTAPDPVTSLVTDFTTGDLDIKWTNPITPYKDIEIKLYESSSKITNYKTWYIQGTTVMFTAEDNLNATANAGDRSIYIEIKARSWLNLTSSTVSSTVTKALPSPPSNVVQTWTGDDGTFPASVTITWDAEPYAKSYRVAIDSVAVYEVSTNIFEYTYQQNVADHLGSGDFGDPTLNIAINTIDRINQSSTGAPNNVVTNAAPPGSSVITLTAVGGFSTISAFIDLTKPIKDINYYIWELHDGVSVVQTINSSGQIISFDGQVSGTYTVRVKAVDLFNRQGSVVTSSSVVLDALTIEELRAEAKYTDDQGRTSPALDVLKDDDISTTINYTHTASGAYHWTKITRPLIDRYGVLSYYSPDATEVYFGISLDDITYTWYSGPVDSNFLVTEVASEAAAKTARISVAGATARRFQLPAIKEARYIKVGHRSNNAGSYIVAEIYPRRLIQSDDIQAETIQTINLGAGIITADKTTTTMLNATFAFAGEIVVSTAGKIRSGQTAYDTGTGFYLGNDSGVPKFSIGKSDRKFTWDGTDLSLIGSFIIRTATTNQKVEITAAGLKGYNSSGVVQVEIDTSDGKLKAGGGSVTLDSTGVIITTGGNIRSGQTAYDTGTGWWIGNDGGTPKLSIGNASGDKLTWNGTVLAVTGQFNLSGVATIGTSGGLYQGTGSFASPTTGLKLYNSGGVGKLSAYNSGTEQVTIDTDGKLKVGAGDVILDATGISLKSYDNAANPGYNNTRAITWKRNTDSTRTSFIQTDWYTYASGTKTVHALYINAEAAGGNTENGQIQLYAQAISSSFTNLVLALDGSNGKIVGRADEYDFLGILTLSDTSNSDRMIFVDLDTYSDGVAKTFNIHFRAKNSSGVYTNDSATIRAVVTPNAGITIPQSYLSFYTKDNSIGYGERIRVEAGGNLNALFGINIGSATGAGTGQLKASSGIFVGSTDAGGSASSSNDMRVSGSSTLSIGSTDAYNTPPKARLWGVTKYTSGGSYTNGPYLEFGKENATDGNYSYYIALAVRASGGSTTEAMRITSARTVLIGLTSGNLTGAGDLEVNGAFQVRGNLNVYRDSTSRTGYIVVPLATPAKDTGSWDGHSKNAVGYTSIDLQNASTFNLPASIKGVFVRFAAKPASATAGGYIALSADQTNDAIVLWAFSTTDYQEGNAFIPTSSGDIYYHAVGVNWSNVYLQIYGYVI